MSAIEVGAYLRERRESRGLSRDTVAERIGASQRTIQRIEAGEYNAASSTVFALAVVVGANLLHVAQLFKEPPMTTNDQSFTGQTVRIPENTPPPRYRVAINSGSGGSMAGAVEYFDYLPETVEQAERELLDLQENRGFRAVQPDGTIVMIQAGTLSLCVKLQPY